MSLPSDPWFHTGRRDYYLGHAGGDLARADALCRWDRVLRRALFADIEELHHGITAAYAEAFAKRWSGPGHWLGADGPLQLAGPIDLNRRNRLEVAEAVERAGGPQAVEYDVLVKLSLGVWNVMTSKGREHDLWVPYVRHAYPRATRRAHVHELVSHLRAVRNRVCHHESLLGFGAAAHTRLAELCGLVMPGHAASFAAQSRVDAVLRRRP